MSQKKFFKQFYKRLIVSLSYRNLFLISTIARNLQFEDDFDWSNYANSTDYISPTGNFGSDFQKDFSLLLSGLKYKIQENRIVYKGKKELYPTHELLLNFALKTNPKLVLEFGCGHCAHLVNLKDICKNSSLSGADISLDMKGLALNNYSSYLNHSTNPINFYCVDLTRKKIYKSFNTKYDLVYVHQVLLHIHRKFAADNFILNMINASKRYVLFIENFNRHSLIKKLNKLAPTYTIYRLENDFSVAILIDKENNLDLPIIKNDRELRSIQIKKNKKLSEKIKGLSTKEN